MRPSISDYFAAAYTGRQTWWQWFLGALFLVVFYIACGIALYFIAYSVKPDMSAKSLGEYFLLMISFLPLFFGLFLVHKYWHKRPSLTLLTAAPRFRWGHLARGGLAVVLVYALFIGVELAVFPEEFKELTRNPDMGLFFKALLITLIFVPFQAASEEIFLRGYFNQALIKYLRSPWLVFIVTSALFASLHLANPEADGQVWPYMFLIFAFGMAACVLLYFEGGIESAIGVHIVNNYFAFSLIGYEDPEMPDTALFNAGKPVIEWSDAGWEIVSLSLIVVLTLWMNRRASRK